MHHKINYLADGSYKIGTQKSEVKYNPLALNDKPNELVEKFQYLWDLIDVCSGALK